MANTGYYPEILADDNPYTLAVAGRELLRQYQLAVPNITSNQVLAKNRVIEEGWKHCGS